MRKSSLTTVALAALVTMLVATVGAAGASPGIAADHDGISIPVARGEDPDDNDDDGRRDRRRSQGPEQNPCPEELWNVALPIEGLACVLLLPKEDAPGAQDEESDEDRRGRGRRDR